MLQPHYSTIPANVCNLELTRQKSIFLPISFILLHILVIFGTCSSSFSEETTQATLPIEGLHFTGMGSTETEHFSVEGGWEVIWETTSESFQLSAYGVTEPGYRGVMTEQEQILRSFETFQPIVLANSTALKGKAFHRVGGTFYLKIVSTDSWMIHLRPVKRTKNYLDVPYTGAP
ncbi:MAG: hypothetical protein ACPGYT_00360 [Nitrospirales bacterium]